MNKDTLIQLFKAPYKRQAFIDNALLPTFQGKVANLKIFDVQGVQKIELTASEQHYAVYAVKYGEFQTLDELPRTVELFEVIVNDNKQIERSRVGLGALVKKHIIGNNAVLVNFAYQNPEKRSWRFSFIARDGVFQDGEMQITDTHPKRYTYVFGEPEETYKTALDRFSVLGNELEITINKIKDAFGVEAMSNQFFEDYKYIHYAGFVEFITGERLIKQGNKDVWQITKKPDLQFINCFKLHQTEDKGKKDVRDFVKKLLGRIVFLYFLQKKGWLGAKDTTYKNGDKNFMTNFFKKAGASDAFYANWLSKLFFDALNNERPNDDFTMPDGEVVKIPYLNGGLFEKESAKYDFLTFPADLFTNLFAFFDQYNFTIFEDSPEEHTVAVDPEMLGHIFENLLEDNKDKGAFYTPKEIVHYMTQESLIEYLHTQIPDASRNDLEHFVKNKENKLRKEYKQQIDQKLETVKICDPAIGSGAFPMGLLQEIFGLKERIAYDLGYKDWSPATVKENIIQKSIYGVDIERGAVDIARLRFWLSLIVDEEVPKALPNLDYKIVVGNSLVSKFDDTVIEIDWNEKSKAGRNDANLSQMRKDLVVVSEKQKQFFESKSNSQKAKLKAEIKALKLEILINQLSFNKASYLNKNQKVTDMGFGLKASDHKKNVEIDLQVAEFNKTLTKLKHLKNNPKQNFNHFDWKLDFPEVLNPLVNDKFGFDIVIGNPPYVSYYGNTGSDLKDDELKYVVKSFDSVLKENDRINSMNLFSEKSLLLLKEGGSLSFIVNKTMAVLPSYKEFRGFFLKNVEFKYAITDLIPFEAIVDCFVFSVLKKQDDRPYNFKFYKGGLTDYSTENILSFVNNSKKEFHISKSRAILEKIDLAPDIFSDILTINRGVNIGGCFDIFLSNRKESSNYKKYLSGTKCIKPYQWEWDNSDGFMIFDTKKEKELRKNGKTIALGNPERYKKPRVVIPESSQKIMAAFIEEEIYTAYGLLVGTSEKNNLLRYAYGLLNSKLISFYCIEKEILRKGNKATPHVGVKGLSSVPIFKNTPKSFIISICTSFIDISKSNISLKLYFGHSNISGSFEEVIDALVFELYFPDEFTEKGIEIEKYAQELFKPIDGLSEEEQIKAIQEAYETLREKDNPLRNQIKLMKIELRELLLPILSV